MCNNCHQNNCGCNEPVYDLCNKCPPQECACPIQLSSNCITLDLSDPLPCSGIESGLILTEAIQQLDANMCAIRDDIEASINLVNVGTGAELYKGIDGIGRREIKSITSTDNSITITENTDSINIAVPAVDQNNFVRQLFIDYLDLPDPYTPQDICDYILALPTGQRTIAPTDSKWNVIPIQVGEGTLFIEVYEIQNKGKGIITALTPDNLLLIKAESPGLQDVLLKDSNLPFGNTITVEQEFNIFSDSGTPHNGITLRPLADSSPTVPIYQEGAGIGVSNQERSLAYYTDRTEFADGLNSRGIQYKGDYEANFVARSLVTSKYVLDRTTGAETKINAGTNVTVSGVGTIASPYVINANNGGDGSETKINAGTNISVTGTGTIATPYVINNTLVVNGSETKLNSGTTTTVTGNGTVGTPYVVETVNLQKIIPATNYVLTSADNNYVIFINNASTDITITVPTGLSSGFQCGFMQQGAGIVTFTASGTTINTPTGLKIKGQNYDAFIEKVLATEVYHLSGDITT